VGPVTDWDRYRKCEACAAEISKPCLQLSGVAPGGAAVAVEADRPHGGRELRVGYARVRKS
jgi:hypothetical protein